MLFPAPICSLLVISAETFILPSLYMFPLSIAEYPVLVGIIIFVIDVFPYGSEYTAKLPTYIILVPPVPPFAFIDTFCSFSH